MWPPRHRHGLRIGGARGRGLSPVNAHQFNALLAGVVHGAYLLLNFLPGSFGTVPGANSSI